MTIQEWQKLYDSLEITVAERAPKAVKPTIEQLREYEREANFKFPATYCDFIRVFGPGVFCEHFKFLAPGYPKLKQRGDMRAFNKVFVAIRTTGREFFSSYKDCEPKRIARLQCFATTSRGEPIGWDPNEVTDPDQHEYPIYIGLEDFRPFRRLASTFREFIYDVCLGDGYNRLFLDDPNDALMPVPYDRSCFRGFIDAGE